MAKEEEFAMIEELDYSLDVLIKLDDSLLIDEIGISSSHSTIKWNKHEFKAFIDELLVLHSKMK